MTTDDLQALRTALADLAEEHGHPELARVAREAADEIERKMDVDVQPDPTNGNLPMPYGCYRRNPDGSEVWLKLAWSDDGDD